jgi:hypothetical protein
MLHADALVSGKPRRGPLDGCVGSAVHATMAGGSARDIADTVEIQFNTIETAA